MRYYERQFSEFGDISYQFYQSVGEVQDFLPRIKWIERQSWKHDARTGLFCINGSRKFYDILLPMLAEKNNVEIDALYVGNECVAYQLGFIHPGYYAVHNISHQRAYSKLSPGLHLQLHVFERLFKSNVPFFDFLQGNHTYKDRYKPDTEALMEATLFSKSLRGKLNNITISFARKLRRGFSPVRNDPAD